MLKMNVIHITVPGRSVIGPYEDVIHAFVCALQDLNFEVDFKIDSLREDAINIVFIPWGMALHQDEDLFIQDFERLASQTILMNLEQVYPGSPAFSARMFRWMMQASCNWDYYPSNVSAFQKAGIEHIELVRIMPHWSMAWRMPKTAIVQDIDVLFIGACNERRNQILQTFENHGLPVTVPVGPQGIWGEDMWQYIARSKIVLNLRGTDSNRLFEVIRCLWPIYNHKLVISEFTQGLEIYPELEPCVVQVPKDVLPDVCQDYLQNPSKVLAQIADHDLCIANMPTLTQSLEPAIKKYLSFYSKSRPITKHMSLSVMHLNEPLGQCWDFSNLYVSDNEHISADVIIPSHDRLLLNEPIPSWRFGQVIFEANMFETIHAQQCLAFVSDVVACLTLWLTLLKVGGQLHLRLPYYLHSKSYDVLILRQFSEHSFVSFIGEAGQRWGWGQMAFELVHTSYAATELGRSLLANGKPLEEVVRVPEAIELMNFTLKKVDRTT